MEMKRPENKKGNSGLGDKMMKLTLLYDEDKASPASLIYRCNSKGKF